MTALLLLVVVALLWCGGGGGGCWFDDAADRPWVCCALRRLAGFGIRWVGFRSPRTERASSNRDCLMRQWAARYRQDGLRAIRSCLDRKAWARV